MVLNKQVLYGFVDEVIYEVSKQNDLTIIGKYSHGSKKTFLGFLGSNTERIMASIEKPLLIVPQEYKQIKRILICYDGSPRAKIALNIAYDYAKFNKSELTILSIKEDKEDVEVLLNEAVNLIKDSAINIKTVSSAGDTSEKILLIATPEQFDLVVMGAHGHRKIKEFIIGTTSSHVVRKTLCPVILAR